MWTTPLAGKGPPPTRKLLTHAPRVAGKRETCPPITNAPPFCPPADMVQVESYFGCEAPSNKGRARDRGALVRLTIFFVEDEFGEAEASLYLVLLGQCVEPMLAVIPQAVTCHVCFVSFCTPLPSPTLARGSHLPFAFVLVGDILGDVAISFTCDPANRAKLAEMALEEVEVRKGGGRGQGWKESEKNVGGSVMGRSCQIWCWER